MKNLALCGALATVMLAATSGSQAQSTADNLVSVFARGNGPAIQTFGPDRDNRYIMRIVASDLDLATAAGWSAMTSRARRGAMMLCDAAADGPQISGFYDAGSRRCLSQTMGAAQTQMARARDNARLGRPTAQLDVSTAIALR